MKLLSSFHRRERGQALVELAFVMSLMCFLVLGVTDVARLFGTSEQLTNAANEGAKLAAEDYTSYSGNLTALTSLVKAQIAQEGELTPSKIVNLQITLKNPGTLDYTGEQIVQVSFQYQFTFVGPWGLLPGISNPYTMPTVEAAEVTH